MDTSGQVAEQMVKYSMEGIEYSLKVVGAGAERLAAILMAAAKDQQKTKGKTTLSALLKSGKELTVFTIPDDRLKDFAKEAKRYGVLYCVIKEKKPRPDALSDILVRAEDAAKINRIIERLEIGKVDILKAAPEVVELTPDQQAAQAAEEVLAQIIKEPASEKESRGINPPNAQTENFPPFGPSSVPSAGASINYSESLMSISRDSESLAENALPLKPEQKPSVRATLTKIRQGLAETNMLEQSDFALDQQLSKILEEQR